MPCADIAMNMSPVLHRRLGSDGHRRHRGRRIGGNAFGHDHFGFAVLDDAMTRSLSAFFNVSALATLMTSFHASWKRSSGLGTSIRSGIGMRCTANVNSNENMAAPPSMILSGVTASHPVRGRRGPLH